MNRFVCTLLLSLLCLPLLALTGCSDGNASFSGNVTAGGKPPVADTLSMVLSPEDGSKGTVIEVAKDGTFNGKATPGANKVSFVLYGDLKASGIAKKYTSEETSTLTVNIDGSTATKDFEIGE